ncbi:Crotonyl-CoA hydratase [Paraconexibacter sp. AEG42_29]|uniref:Crotonyl-CoA hydratase n=1 Tax=Paraconexibacter sp. AEG42_29 TaxID=2997339 RepID=A0AAU7AUN8_9ACTN
MSTAQQTDAVLHEQRGAGLWLTLNRPSNLNGLSPEILDGLLTGITRAEQDPAIRAVVITHAGRAFCAGADLAHIQALQEREGTALPFLEEVGVAFARIEASPVPVIAAVAGIAAGGGLELLLCCDIVLLAEGARAGDAHATYGLLPGGGSSARLPRAIGRQRAKQLLFTGDLLPARELFALGFGNEVLPDDALPARAQALVESLAQKSPLALARVKRLADDGLEQTLAVAVRSELTAVALHEHSFDQQEGAAAFHAKRRPAFEGR